MFPQAAQSALPAVDKHEAQRIVSLVLQTFRFSQDRLLVARDCIKAEEAAGGVASVDAELRLVASSNVTMHGCDSQEAAAEILWAEEQPCDNPTPLRESPALAHGDATMAVEESGLWVAADWDEAELAAAEGVASPGACGVHAAMRPCRPESPRPYPFAEPQPSFHTAGAPPPGRRRRAAGAAGRRVKRARREDKFGTR
jgi:hypothetical protein